MSQSNEIEISIIEFDVNQYLIENHSRLNLSNRRAICKFSVDYIDPEEYLAEAVDQWVANYASITCGFSTLEDLLDEDDEEEEEVTETKGFGTD